jgi:molybdopterin synthase sulfur carrier subunit
MAVDVRIPPVLRKYTSGANTVRVDGATIAEVLQDLDRHHPGFKRQIFDEQGNLHQFINVYRNGEDIRYLGQLSTEIGAGDVVAILPAVAGGAPRRA